jgi:hypothetical protein
VGLANFKGAKSHSGGTIRRSGWCVALSLAFLSIASTARAGDAPQKLSGADAVTLKTVLLFPSPSELATRLKSAGVQVAGITKLNERVPSPDWPKLAPQDRQLQLGSVLGYLAFAAAAADMTAVAACFDQILLGAEALGVDKSSKAYTATLKMRDRIRSSQITDSQVLAGLDDLRRDTLRELASRGDLIFILAAAWLRGSSLLAKQVKTDSDAAKFAEFIMRPELVDFIGRMPDPVSGAASPVRRAAADRILATTSKSTFRPEDYVSFVAFADKVLNPSTARP